jgi:hypothetical protein
MLLLPVTMGMWGISLNFSFAKTVKKSKSVMLMTTPIVNPMVFKLNALLSNIMAPAENAPPNP